MQHKGFYEQTFYTHCSDANRFRTIMIFSCILGTGMSMECVTSFMVYGSQD